MDYVFLERDGVSVTGSVPRGCSMLPALELRVRLPPSHLPARLEPAFGPAVALDQSDTRVLLPLPAGRRGRLREGDHGLAITVAGERRWTFVVGVDPDGTPVALSGYVANW